mgnify:CR=1
GRTRKVKSDDSCNAIRNDFSFSELNVFSLDALILLVGDDVVIGFVMVISMSLVSVVLVSFVFDMIKY